MKTIRCVFATKYIVFSIELDSINRNNVNMWLIELNNEICIHAVGSFEKHCRLFFAMGTKATVLTSTWVDFCHQDPRASHVAFRQFVEVNLRFLLVEASGWVGQNFSFILVLWGILQWICSFVTMFGNVFFCEGVPPEQKFLASPLSSLWSIRMPAIICGSPATTFFLSIVQLALHYSVQEKRKNNASLTKS